MKTLHVALIPLLAGFCSPLLSPPTQAAEQAEMVDVHAPRQVLVQHYQKVGRFYRRFNNLPEQDRGGLSLHVMGRILPDNKPLETARLHLQSQSGSIPLSQPGSDALIFPLSDALWQENPPIMATLASNEQIHFTFQIAVKPKNPSSFSALQAQAWLKQLDLCVKDVVGTVFSWLTPNATVISLTVAPHSTMTVSDSHGERTLFANTTDTPKPYALQPKNYDQDAVFKTTQPLEQIMLKIPVDLHADLKKKG